MSETVTLPLWLVLLLVLLAAWAALDRLLMPSVRWYIRRSTNRVLNEINARLAIKIQPFQRTARQVLVDRLLYDPAVQAAAEAHAKTSDPPMPREVAMQAAERYAREIVPAFNAYMYFRLGYWLSRRLARLLYRVRLGYLDEAGLSRVPADASVVFVMNHRSNMDYVLVGYLAAERVALSYAVGEWARVWPLQTLIRAMGAYFVRRNAGANVLYRRVLERYVAMATAGGVPQAVYPEGRLSRDGRLQPPKLGLIDYMLRGFDPQRDLVFIPVAINYDRTLEDRSLQLMLTPEQARPSTGRALATGLRFTLRSLRLMLSNRWYRFGYACVNFGQPLSLREYLLQRGIGNDLAALPRERRVAEVERLGNHLMRQVGRLIPVLPVALAATVFIRNTENPLSELELKARVFALMETLSARGARVYVPRQDQDYALTVGLRALSLRRLVQEQNGLFRVANEPQALALLAYYANSIAHLLPDDNNDNKEVDHAA